MYKISSFISDNINCSFFLKFSITLLAFSPTLLVFRLSFMLMIYFYVLWFLTAFHIQEWNQSTTTLIGNCMHDRDFWPEKFSGEWPFRGPDIFIKGSKISEYISNNISEVITYFKYNNPPTFCLGSELITCLLIDERGLEVVSSLLINDTIILKKQKSIEDNHEAILLTVFGFLCESPHLETAFMFTKMPQCIII